MKKVHFLAVLFIFCLVVNIQAAEIVRYEFNDFSGNYIADVSGVSPALSMVIEDYGKTQWLNPGLRILEPVLIKTFTPRVKLKADKFFADGIAIEAWVRPANNTQGGPARLVTFSKDSGIRNFTLGQEKDVWVQRFVTSVNTGNGTNPDTRSAAATIGDNPELQHVVFTRYPTGSTVLYVNGQVSGSADVPGDSTPWDPEFGFGLFNELSYPTDDRTWLGDVFLIAIHDTVMTAAEASARYAAGPPAAKPRSRAVGLAWDANTESDLAGYKIYYGALARDQVVGAIEAWCQANEPNNAKCIEEWEKICTSGDQVDRACHVMLYRYDKVVDVGNVTEYTLRGLEEGKRYFISATAYDKDNNESNFSAELSHWVEYSAPGQAGDLQQEEIEVLKFKQFPDSIKGGSQ